MGAQGIVTLTFASNGGSDMATSIPGQTGITAGACVEAWVMAIPTATHSADEHMVEEIQSIAGDISVGVGFNIRLRTRNKALYGDWTGGWVWN